MIWESIKLFIVISLVFFYIGSFVRIICVRPKLNKFSVFLGSILVMFAPLIITMFIFGKKSYESVNVEMKKEHNKSISRGKFILFCIYISLTNYSKTVDVIVNSISQTSQKHASVPNKELLSHQVYNDFTNSLKSSLEYRLV